MVRISKVTFWIYIVHIIGIGKSNSTAVEQTVFAIAGCNVTLEWALRNSSFEIPLTSIQVYNSSGIKIVSFDGHTCENVNDSSVYCRTSKHGEEWFLCVVLIYVTPVKEGLYMGQIDFGADKIRNITKMLIVVDRPQIIKPKEAILTKPLYIICTVDGKLENVNYRWKLNETYLNSTGRIYARSSNLTFESLLTVDRSSIFSCEVCRGNSCCIQSETFVIDPYFISTAPTSQKYKDVISTAPTSQKYKDVISTESTSQKYKDVISMARSTQKHNDGTYVASMSPSSPEHSNGLQTKDLIIAVVIVVVVLIIASISMFLTLLRKYIYGRSDSGTLHQPLERPVRRVVSREMLRIEIGHRPLPIPPVQEGECSRIKRSGYQNGRRKSRSLQTLLDNTKDVWNPVRKSLSLQTLKQLSLSLNNPLDESFKQQPQEHMCSSLDEAAVSVYNYSRTNEHEENLQEDLRKAEIGNYDYDYAILPAL